MYWEGPFHATFMPVSERAHSAFVTFGLVLRGVVALVAGFTGADKGDAHCDAEGKSQSNFYKFVHINVPRLNDDPQFAGIKSFVMLCLANVWLQVMTR
jgi:hypothetical protein